MTMDEAWREKVRERAYAIWLREGSPDGQAEQFWLLAEEELLAEGQGRASGPPGERRDPPAWGGETGAGAPAGAGTPGTR